MKEKAKVSKLLKTAKGQIEGILKMVEEDQYCVNISHQLLAVESVISKINQLVLTGHLKTCVNNAKTPEEQNEKIDELISLLGKVMK